MLSPFLGVPDLEKSAAELIARKAYTEACDQISGAVMNICNDAQFIGKQIYLPTLDNLVERIGKELTAQKPLRDNSHIGHCPIIVATELYFDGGHTRVVEELIRILGGGIVILTNYFGGSGRPDNTLPQAIKDISSIVLPKDTAANNILRLHSICAQIASEIFHLAHHHDVVANAALSSPMNAPVFFVHHSDHKMTLGATNGSFVHVDIVRHMHGLCSGFLQRPIEYWPQGVSDRGARKFSYPLSDVFSASSAVWNKFDWEGELSYPDAVVKILNSGVTRHHHIGALPEAAIDLIRKKLVTHSIDVNRFHCVGVVNSLWQCLLDLQIHLFVGSAPIHGLRTAIEVQGAGIPILPFRQRGRAILEEVNFYNKDALFWGSLEELSLNITAAIADHDRLAKSARDCYEREFSSGLMEAAIVKARNKYRRPEGR